MLLQLWNQYECIDCRNRLQNHACQFFHTLFPNYTKPEKNFHSTTMLFGNKELPPSEYPACNKWCPYLSTPDNNFYPEQWLFHNKFLIDKINFVTRPPFVVSPTTQ